MTDECQSSLDKQAVDRAIASRECNDDIGPMTSIDRLFQWATGSRATQIDHRSNFKISTLESCCTNRGERKAYPLNRPISTEEDKETDKQKDGNGPSDRSARQAQPECRDCCGKWFKDKKKVEPNQDRPLSKISVSHSNYSTLNCKLQSNEFDH